MGGGTWTEQVCSSGRVGACGPSSGHLCVLVTPPSLLRVASDVITGDSKAGLSAHRSPAMSTLLEIKSSVLRQVQVCPSFRRRTEEEPASSSADPPEPAAGAWWVPPSRLPSSPDLTHQPPSTAPRGSPGGSEPKAVESVSLHPQLFRDPGIALSHAGWHVLRAAAWGVSADPDRGFSCRKPGDGVEFFAQMRLILKKGEGRQGLPCPEVRTLRALLLRMGPGRPPQRPLCAPLPPSLPGALPVRESWRHSPPWCPHRSCCAAAHPPPQSPWTPAVA